MTSTTPSARGSIAETAEAAGWQRRWGPVNDLYKRGEDIITVDWDQAGTPSDISRYGPAGIERANHPRGVEQVREWLEEPAPGEAAGAAS